MCRSKKFILEIKMFFLFQEIKNEHDQRKDQKKFIL